MVWFFITIFTLFFVVGLSSNGFGKKLNKMFKQPVPEKLGVRKREASVIILNKLEKSLDKEYIENVKKRMLKEDKSITEEEFNWRYFELKRFFFLTSILKEVPMFSDEVDEVWHTMLMFTRDYEKFAINYVGKQLHHNPNVTGKSDIDERIMFEWIYSKCFDVYAQTNLFYSGFFKTPINTKTLKGLNSMSIEEIKDKYFKEQSEYQGLIYEIIFEMKNDITEILNRKENQIKDIKKKRYVNDKMNHLIVPVLYYSYFHYDDFHKYMWGKMTNSTSCNYAACGTCSSDSSSGCSSSSCGGGCSS